MPGHPTDLPHPLIHGPQIVAAVTHTKTPPARTHTFTIASLQALANKLGRHLASDGRMLHTFTTEPLDPRWLRAVSKQRRARRMLKLLRKQPPLTWRDAEVLTQALRAQQSANAPPR